MSVPCLRYCKNHVRLVLWHPSNLVLTVTDSSITPLLRWLPVALLRIVKISAVVYRSHYVLLHCTPTWSCTSLHLPHLWLILSLMFLIICLRLSLDFEFWSTLYVDWSKRQEHCFCDNLDVSLCVSVSVTHWTLCSSERNWARNQDSLTSEPKFPNSYSRTWNRKIIVSMRKLKPGEVKWLSQHLTELERNPRLPWLLDFVKSLNSVTTGFWVRPHQKLLPRDRSKLCSPSPSSGCLSVLCNFSMSIHILFVKMRSTWLGIDWVVMTDSALPDDQIPVPRTHIRRLTNTCSFCFRGSDTLSWTS